MTTFEPGDKVIIIAGPHKGPEVHTVRPTTSRQYPLRVADAAYTAEGAWYSTNNRVCLRHATAEEIAASKKPKPIRRGDLVMCHGGLWVVHSKGEGSDGDYWIASLTGDPETHYATIDELTRVGSIRKKVKRIKKAMEGGK